MEDPLQAPPSALSDWLAGYAGRRAPRRSAPWRALAVLAMVCGLAMVLWSLPVPAGIGRPGLYAALVGVALVGRYLRLSRGLAMLALGLLLPLGALVGGLHGGFGADALLAVGAALLAAGMVGAALLASAYAQPLVAAIIEDAWLGPAWLIDSAAQRLGFRL
jgi:hypothetical protein